MSTTNGQCIGLQYTSSWTLMEKLVVVLRKNTYQLYLQDPKDGLTCHSPQAQVSENKTSAGTSAQAPNESNDRSIFVQLDPVTAGSTNLPRPPLRMQKQSSQWQVSSIVISMTMKRHGQAGTNVDSTMTLEGIKHQASRPEAASSKQYGMSLDILSHCGCRRGNCIS
jgi:hypothetical protein